MRALKKNIKIMALALALLMTFQSSILAFANSSSSEPDSSSGQYDKYDAAAKACSKAKTGQMIAGGLWAAEAALCGYNCFQFLGPLRAAMAALGTAASDGSLLIAAANACPGVSVEVNDAYKDTAAVIAHNSAFQAGVAAVSPAMTAVSPSTLATMAVENAIAATATATAGAQKAAAAATSVASAGTVTAVIAAICLAGAASAEAAATKLSAAATQVAQLAAQITTLGQICAYSSIAVAGADIALAASLSKKTTEGLLGIAGAAPALYTLVTTRQAQALPLAFSMGASSCWTSGLSLLLAGVKFLGANQSNKCEKENRQRANELSQDGANSPLITGGPGSNAARPGGNSQPPSIPTSGSFGSDQPASQIPKISSDSLALAKASDPLIAKIEEEKPGLFALASTRAEELFGKNPSEFIDPKTFDLSSLADLITRPSPNARGAVASLIQGMQNELPKTLSSNPGMNAEATSLPSSALSAIPQSGGGGGGGPGAGAGMESLFDALQKGADSGPLEAQNETFAKAGLSSSVVDGIETDRSVSLFERVSRRYQASRPRLSNLKYQSRENKMLSR